MKTTGRLAIVKRCATCAASFRPSHQGQLCCSRVCGAIRRHKVHPMPTLAAMRVAYTMKRERYRASLAKKLEGKTLLEAFQYGESVGYNRAWKRRERLERRA